MIAWVLKTSFLHSFLKTRSKYIKGSEEWYLLGQKHNLQIFGGSPLYQTTKWHLTMKNEMKS